MTKPQPHPVVTEPDTPSNDYACIPATEKQLIFARRIAQQRNLTLPWDVQQDRRKLSDWIDRHKAPATGNRFSHYPTSRQVAFAERLARIRRSAVPPECFRDRGLMSTWIDANR